MAIGLVGRKCGMTRIFQEDGQSVPVTVVEVEPNRITFIKTKDNDGYSAIQVTAGKVKPSKVNKPLTGHYRKAETAPGRGLWEFSVDATVIEDKSLSIGTEIKVDFFATGQMVDVSGVSKGKGFAGAVKRHNFRTQDATHGNSRSHRAPGSIGQNQSPGRVFKGKKMAGHMGNENVTIQNLEITKIDVERNLILIRGAVPGATGRDVIIRPAVKHQQEVIKDGN